MQALKLLPEWWIPPSESARVAVVPSYVPAMFLVKPLDFGTRELVWNLLAAESPSYGSVRALCVRGGLDGWKGIYGADGAEVKLQLDPAGRPKDESLALLPMAVVREIADEVWRRSTLSEDVQGKSG